MITRIGFGVSMAMLIGCSTPSQLTVPDLAESQASGMLAGGATVDVDQTVFGTLASNPVEAAAAPVYTGLAMLRTRAASDLRARRIGVDQARLVQSDADRIRARVDAAVMNEDLIEIWSSLDELKTIFNQYEDLR